MYFDSNSMLFQFFMNQIFIPNYECHRIASKFLCFVGQSSRYFPNQLRFLIYEFLNIFLTSKKLENTK